MIPRGRGRNHFGLIMLGMQVMRFGYDRIPPCTLTLMIVCIVFSLGLVPMELLHSAGIHSDTDLMLIPSRVIFNLELSRLATSLVYHAQDWHLYYNMTSLLWKGSSLERAVGTKRQIVITLILSVLSQLMYVGYAYLRMEVLEDSSSLYTALCGFSGVLFGYKVLLTQGAPPDHMSALMGILPLQTRYLVWGELLLMHFMFPNSSFIAHLCGIVAALMIGMGWFDSIIALADLMPDVDLNGAQAPIQVENQGDHQQARFDEAWQAQPPPRNRPGIPVNNRQEANLPIDVDARDEGRAVEEIVPQAAPIGREEMRQRALEAAEARRRRR